jgi:hypothetical protein
VTRRAQRCATSIASALSPRPKSITTRPANAVQVCGPTRASTLRSWCRAPATGRPSVHRQKWGESDGQTYFFAVTAYDSSNNDSGYSNEESKTIN